MVSARSGTFLNYVATIDDKHIATRKPGSSGFVYYKYTFFQQHLIGYCRPRLQVRVICDLGVFLFSVCECPGTDIPFGSFGRLRKHAQSCATVCKCEFLIAKGDIKYFHATQRILAKNSNRLSLNRN